MTDGTLVDFASMFFHINPLPRVFVIAGEAVDLIAEQPVDLIAGEAADLIAGEPVDLIAGEAIDLTAGEPVDLIQ
jgi:hypothetical protein